MISLTNRGPLMFIDPRRRQPSVGVRGSDRLRSRACMEPRRVTGLSRVKSPCSIHACRSQVFLQLKVARWDRASCATQKQRAQRAQPRSERRSRHASSGNAVGEASRAIPVMPLASATPRWRLVQPLPDAIDVKQSKRAKTVQSADM